MIFVSVLTRLCLFVCIKEDDLLSLFYRYHLGSYV